ncbi:MAG: hypothetical protein V2B19_12380 [Pseudomonadota bacterium]
MATGTSKKFAEKHTGKTPDLKIEAELARKNIQDELPCAVAFDIASRLNVAPAEVGITADLLNIKISKCQIGLFGYQPDQKPISTAKEPTAALREALQSAQKENRITCPIAWEIADRLKVSKIAVGRACEAMGIKIKKCQLGGF